MARALWSVLKYEVVREFMSRTASPWVLKPRSEASAIGIRKLEHSDDLWPVLDQLGDRQSYHLLEKFVPGEVFHVDSVISEGKVVFSEVHQYGRPPMQVSHGGRIFTTRTLKRTRLNSNHQLIPNSDVLMKKNHAHFTTVHT